MFALYNLQSYLLHIFAFIMYKLKQVDIASGKQSIQISFICILSNFISNFWNFDKILTSHNKNSIKFVKTNVIQENITFFSYYICL